MWPRQSPQSHMFDKAHARTGERHSHRPQTPWSSFSSSLPLIPCLSAGIHLFCVRQILRDVRCMLASPEDITVRHSAAPLVQQQHALAKCCVRATDATQRFLQLHWQMPCHDLAPQGGYGVTVSLRVIGRGGKSSDEVALPKGRWIFVATILVSHSLCPCLYQAWLLLPTDPLAECCRCGC